MTASRSALVIASGWMIFCPALLAHHSFLVEFDQNKPMTVTGVVTKVEWMNPHSYFYVDVQDSSGKVVKWSFETASPSALAMRGWNRDTVRVGDKVTVQGYRTKRESNLAAARLVSLPDGRQVYSGTMDDGGPNQ